MHVVDHLNKLGLQRWKLIHVGETGPGPSWTFIFCRALIPDETVMLTEDSKDYEHKRLVS